MSSAPSSAPKKKKRGAPLWVILLILVIILGGGGALAWKLLKPSAPKDPYKTAAVTRGNLQKTVSASGTTAPLLSVDVSSEVSGKLDSVLVDFNDHVTKGQILATIDKRTFQSAVDSAQADVQSSTASLAQSRAQLAVDTANYNRTKALYDQGFQGQSALETAQATLQRSQASVDSAVAHLAQSQSSLESKQTDLSRTSIISPIDGIVIDRKVEAGNTVSASTQAPTLFTIANDLSEIETSIKVDESDIGEIKAGQTVNYTVDAFPNDSFTATIAQKQVNATTTSNVTAYTVLAIGPNTGNKLLPGMTANADIVTEEKTNVLRVTAAALRWTPNGVTGANTAPAFGGGRAGGAGGLPAGIGGAAGRGGAAGAGRGGAGGPGGAAGRGGPGGAAGGGGGVQGLATQLKLTSDQTAQLQGLLDQDRVKVAAQVAAEQALQDAQDAQYAQAAAAAEALNPTPHETNGVTTAGGQNATVGGAAAARGAGGARGGAGGAGRQGGGARAGGGQFQGGARPGGQAQGGARQGGAPAAAGQQARGTAPAGQAGARGGAPAIGAQAANGGFGGAGGGRGGRGGRGGAGGGGNALVENAVAMEMLLDQIEPMLKTADQKATLQQLRVRYAQMGARATGADIGIGIVYVLDTTTNTPRPVVVVTGASDGSNTEISPIKDGAIKEGDQVITGGGPKPKATAAAGGGAGGGRGG